MKDKDVREMFRRRESDVKLKAPPSGSTVRRARRREVGTVLVATVVVLALAAVPLAGSRLLSGGTNRRQTPGDSGPVVLPEASDGLRSAALPYASIAYPDGWFLTDTSPLTWYGIKQPDSILSGPVLQLSNFDPDLHSSPRCTFDADPIPDDGVLLSVGVQAPEDTSIDAPTAPWPVELAPYPPNTDPQCAQGVDLTVGWVAPSGAYYWASSTFGKDSSEVDRAALRAAFASMIFPPNGEPWMSTFAADQGQGSPRLILDATVFDDVPVSLVAYLDHYKALVIGVSAPNGSFLGGIGIYPGTGSGPPQPVESSMSSTPSGAVVVGDVALDVLRVEINTQEGKTFPATVIQLPSTMGADRSAAWGFVTGPTAYAQMVGYDADGNLLGNTTVVTAPPDVVASGTDPVGGAWTLSITHDTMGDGLTFSWGSGSGGGGCCLSDKQFAGQDLQLDGYSTDGDEPSVITAFASARVTKVVASLSGGTFDGQLAPFPPKYLGPAQVVVVIVPTDVALDGSLIASDADGNVLQMAPIDGGPAEEPGGPTPAIDEVFQALYATRDAAAKYFDDAGTFARMDLTQLGTLAPSVTLSRSATAVPHEVSVRVTSPNELVVDSTTEDGAVYCIGVQIDEGGGGNFFYGRVDASGFDTCRGGWGLPPIDGG